MTRTIARGDSVKWRNDGYIGHDVTSKLSGYFKSPGGPGGIGRKEEFQKTFKQAGTFGYLCRLHDAYDMKGTITVPIKVTVSGNMFTVTVASTSTSGTKWRNRIQYRKGSGDWKTLTTTTAKSVTYQPSSGSTYSFRSEVRNSQTGATSAWSPVVTRTR